MSAAPAVYCFRKGVDPEGNPWCQMSDGHASECSLAKSAGSLIGDPTTAIVAASARRIEAMVQQTLRNMEQRFARELEVATARCVQPVLRPSSTSAPAG